jgi:hypothetical protein
MNTVRVLFKLCSFSKAILFSKPILFSKAILVVMGSGLGFASPVRRPGMTQMRAPLQCRPPSR